MTTLPAVVTITDLPTGTTITGSELLEAVQTYQGVAQSIRVSASQLFSALGGLPSSAVTGALLQSLGTGVSATWVTAASFVTIGTGLARAGSTSLTLSMASTAGLSVLGVAGTASAVPLAIAGTGAQVLRVNDAGTGLAFGSLNLASSAAVTGVLPGANFSAVNLATSGAGGVQGFLPGTSIVTGSITSTLLATGAVYLASAVVTGVLPGANMSAVSVATTGAGGIQGQPFFLPTTALPAAGASTMGIKISSATTLGFFVGSGTPTFTAGTSSLYLNYAATNATTRLYINTNGTGTWANFTASA
jgi:hypothetical protein